MSKPLLLAIACFILVTYHLPSTSAARVEKATLKVGVGTVAITPFGPDPDWDGTITESGVWGEKFTDTNRNGRWNAGEPFEDDPGNDALDQSSKGKYDGVFLAGFGNNRLATGKHDDLWARAIVLEHGARSSPGARSVQEGRRPRSLSRNKLGQLAACGAVGVHRFGAAYGKDAGLGRLQVELRVAS